MKLFFQLIICSLLIVSCSDDPEISGIPNSDGDSLAIVRVFEALDFVRPVDLQHHDELIFLVEQRGIIQVFENNPSVTSSSTFMDVSGRVDDAGNEEGLLGLAFHPGFSQNGFFYVNYTTANSTTRISRFESSLQYPPQGDPDSEMILLEFPQPYGNHNGGQISFGPDGYLYIAAGDGGSAGDPQGNGQNTGTLLGNILRIDVDHPSANLNYGIPSDNPFAGNQSGAREEIYAYGLRNPWRMSFDSSTGELWTADVGQNSFEEIDIIENGGNYGWKIMEAEDCFQSNCDPAGLMLPYFHYDRSSGSSITGGYVYRGPVKNLSGQYIYADYSTGRIWALETGTGSPQHTLLFDTSHGITTFGVDNEQELYFCSLEGQIYKFVTL